MVSKLTGKDVKVSNDLNGRGKSKHDRFHTLNDATFKQIFESLGDRERQELSSRDIQRFTLRYSRLIDERNNRLIAVWGPAGAGKSTFLNELLGAQVCPSLDIGKGTSTCATWEVDAHINPKDDPGNEPLREYKLHVMDMPGMGEDLVADVKSLIQLARQAERLPKNRPDGHPIDLMFFCVPWEYFLRYQFLRMLAVAHVFSADRLFSWSNTIFVITKAGAMPAGSFRKARQTVVYCFRLLGIEFDPNRVVVSECKTERNANGWRVLPGSLWDNHDPQWGYHIMNVASGNLGSSGPLSTTFDMVTVNMMTSFLRYSHSEEGKMQGVAPVLQKETSDTVDSPTDSELVRRIEATWTQLQTVSLSRDKQSSGDRIENPNEPGSFNRLIHLLPFVWPAFNPVRVVANPLSPFTQVRPRRLTRTDVFTPPPPLRSHAPSAAPPGRLTPPAESKEGGGRKTPPLPPPTVGGRPSMSVPMEDTEETEHEDSKQFLPVPKKPPRRGTAGHPRPDLPPAAHHRKTDSSPSLKSSPPLGSVKASPTLGPAPSSDSARTHLTPPRHRGSPPLPNGAARSRKHPIDVPSLSLLEPRLKKQRGGRRSPSPVRDAPGFVVPSLMNVSAPWTRTASLSSVTPAEMELTGYDAAGGTDQVSTVPVTQASFRNFCASITGVEESRQQPPRFLDSLSRMVPISAVIQQSDFVRACAVNDAAALLAQEQLKLVDSDYEVSEVSPEVKQTEVDTFSGQLGAVDSSAARSALTMLTGFIHRFCVRPFKAPGFSQEEMDAMWLDQFLAPAGAGYHAFKGCFLNQPILDVCVPSSGAFTEICGHHVRLPKHAHFFGASEGQILFGQVWECSLNDSRIRREVAQCVTDDIVSLADLSQQTLSNLISEVEGRGGVLPDSDVELLAAMATRFVRIDYRDIEMSKEFKKAVQGLPDSCTSENLHIFRAFLDHFGTHVVVTAAFGGSLRKTLKRSRADLELPYLLDFVRHVRPAPLHVPTFIYAEQLIREKERDDNGVLRNKELSRGDQGVVYAGTYQGKPVVIKVANPGYELALAGELELAHRLTHRHLVKLVGQCKEANDALGIVYVREPGGSLEAAVKTAQIDVSKDESALVWILIDVVSGMSFMHSQNVIHRDIAQRNVLLDEVKRAMLTDYGLSRLTEYGWGRQPKERVPWPLMAPEAHGNIFNFKTDVYAVGVLAAELLIGKSAHEEFNSMMPGAGADTLVKSIRKGECKLHIPEQTSEIRNAMRSLAMRCLSFEPHQRPSAAMLHAELKELLRKTLPSTSPDSADGNAPSFLALHD